MAENSAGSPMFADRYRFQPVGNDWDTGRSGYTHLVFDTKKERLGVLKRAELKSSQAVENLKNEVAALLDLKGEGVPEVYDTGEAEYGSKKFFYMVIEYIDGLRVEKKLEDLSATERADILLQFWNLLTIAQRMGIVNGDVDLKHLFWRRDKKQLIVIDWGNAHLNIKPNSKNDFAFDWARAAEVTHTLVLRKGRAPVSGSLALPKDTLLLPGLPPIPTEFRMLCKWAPRTPSNNMQPPLMALDMYEATRKWLRGVPYKTIKSANWTARLVFFAILAGVGYFGFTQRALILGLFSPTTIATTPPVATTPPIATTEVIPPSETITPTPTPSETPALEPSLTPTVAVTETATVTATVPVTPSPGIYTTVLMDASKDKCWTNLQDPEGLSDKQASGLLEFRISDSQLRDNPIEANFDKCGLNPTQIKAVGLNAWVKRLEIARTIQGQTEDGREFGIFVENAAGQRREYTIWFDKTYNLQVRIRETGKEPFTTKATVFSQGKLEPLGDFPNQSVNFPIQFFLEVNNQGLDVLYLKEGPKSQSPLDAVSLSPANMIVVDSATRPTLGNIARIGLVGYGGETQIVLWPLAIFGE